MGWLQEHHYHSLGGISNTHAGSRSARDAGAVSQIPKDGVVGWWGGGGGRPGWQCILHRRWCALSGMFHFACAFVGQAALGVAAAAKTIAMTSAQPWRPEVQGRGAGHLGSLVRALCLVHSWPGSCPADCGRDPARFLVRLHPTPGAPEALPPDAATQGLGGAHPIQLYFAVLLRLGGN